MVVSEILDFIFRNPDVVTCVPDVVSGGLDLVPQTVCFVSQDLDFESLNPGVVPKSPGCCRNIDQQVNVMYLLDDIQLSSFNGKSITIYNKLRKGNIRK